MLAYNVLAHLKYYDLTVHSYRQLRIHRITLHKHLFLSLLLEAVGVIVFRFLQLYRNDVIRQVNPTIKEILVSLIMSLFLS